jgi:hypothetical protein
VSRKDTIVKLRNRGTSVDLHRPAGTPGSRYVAEGGEVDILGQLADEQPADAVVLVCSGVPIAYPTSTWELVDDADFETWRSRRPENAEPVEARAKPLPTQRQKPPKEA